MKKIVLLALCVVLCMFLFILGLAPHTAKKEVEPTEYTHVDYVSALQGECFLCGDGSDPIISHYWGEDNVGIINLNTFELLRLEINRYNEHGQPLEEDAGYMQSSHLSGEGSYVHAYSFPDNRYAHVQISGVNYIIDRAVIQSNLCQQCLDTFYNFGSSGMVMAEYAIISFFDRSIQPIMGGNTSISLGMYHINCESNDNRTIDIEVQYYP